MITAVGRGARRPFPATPDVLGGLFSAVAEVAALKGVAETGYRVIVNNGPDASQTVHHLHVHVLGGAPMSHGMARLGEAPRH